MPHADKPLSEILRGAREMLSEPAKWTKGAYHQDGRFCLLGACLKAAGYEPTEQHSGAPWCQLADLEARVDDAIDPRGATIATTLNDHPRTTHADVLRVLDLAIAEASAQEARDAL